MLAHHTVRIAFLAASLTLGLAAAGCDDTTHRGPMEQAGHDVDHAAQRAQHDVNQAGHDIDREAHRATH